MSIGASEVQVALTDRERQQVKRLFGDPTEFPPGFKYWVSSYVQADTTTTLDQIEGWSSYQQGQAALDASQDQQISALQGIVGSGTGDLAAQIAALETDVAGLQNTDNSQTSTLSTHTSQISSLQSTDGTQNTRLSALEAKTFPYVIASRFTSQSTSSTTGASVASLTLPAGVLPAGAVCEFRAWGTWTTQSLASTHGGPTWDVYFATTLVGTTGGSAANATSTLNPYAWEVRALLVNATTSSQQVTTHFTTNGLARLVTSGSEIGTQPYAATHLDVKTAAITTATGSRTLDLQTSVGASTDVVTCAGATLVLLATP